MSILWCEAWIIFSNFQTIVTVRLNFLNHKVQDFCFRPVQRRCVYMCVCVFLVCFAKKENCYNMGLNSLFKLKQVLRFIGVLSLECCNSWHIWRWGVKVNGQEMCLWNRYRDSTVIRLAACWLVSVWFLTGVPVHAYKIF